MDKLRTNSKDGNMLAEKVFARCKKKKVYIAFRSRSETFSLFSPPSLSN